MTRFDRLQTWLTLVFVLVAVVPLLIVSVLISQRSINVIRQDAQSYLLERSQHVASEIEAFIDGRMNTLLYMAQVGRISSNEQSTLINGMLAFDTTYQEVALLDATGIEIERVSRSDVVRQEDYRDRSESPEFTTIKDNNDVVYYGPVRFDGELREPLMTISVAILDRRTGELDKVLVADFRFRTVWQLLNTQNYRVGETAYVVDETGMVVAHRNSSATLRDALVETGFDAPDSNTGEMINALGENVLFAIQPLRIGEQTFAVVSEQTLTQALSLAREVQLISSIAIFALLLLVAGVVVLVVRYFVRPIEHLSEVAQQITTGDLRLRARVQGRGEIPVLARSFNAMADQLSGLIHDLEQRLEDLQRSEEKYRLLTENAHDLVYRIRLIPEMRFEYVSPSSTAMVGYTPEEHYADPDLGLKLIHPDDRYLFEGVGERHSKEPLVLRWIHKNGSVIWTEQNNTYVFDDNGNIVAIEGIARDITERKRSEQALRESEEKYRLLVESSYQGIMIEQIDPIRIAFASQSVQKIIGYTPYEITAMDKNSLLSITHPDDRDVFIQHLVDCVQGTLDQAEIRVRIYHKNGDLRHISAYRVPITYEGAHATQMTFVDITDHVEADRLKNQFRSEQAHNQLIQQVISMLSHDLRTPLAVIDSSRNMLSRYFDRMDDEKRQEKLDIIGRQIQFALEILEDAVSTARGKLGERQFNPTEINLATLCQVSVDEIKDAKHSDRNIRFVNVGDVTLARVDEVLVSRILLNLLSNAVKYSLDGEEIRLELDRRNEWVVLRVIDEGIGISDDDLPRLFDPFYRSDAVQKIEGTGLGLSIVKDCVERHNGRFYVESALGQGSTFTVELPVKASILVSEVYNA